MPRHPDLAARVGPILSGDFGRAPAPPAPGQLARLHIGDSHESPGQELLLAPILSRTIEGWHRYPAPRGHGRLRDALAGFYAEGHDLPTSAGQILVTPGATAGLNTLVHLLCDPGDEVLVPTPAWPLFPGMVRLSGARAVEVPFQHEMGSLDPAQVAARLEAAITPRTTLLWLNTPNNPSGTLMTRDQCEAALAVARRHRLWVISDEAYDGMAFDGRTTPTLARLGQDPALLVVSTFSKMHRAAGLRLGWVRADAKVISAATRVATFQNYSASTTAQLLVEPSVRTRSTWEPKVRAGLQVRRDAFVEALALDLQPPAATYFVFLDLRPWLGPGVDGRAAAADLLERGVCVTAGAEFGTDFRGWIRACFASESVETTTSAAASLGEWVRDRASRRS